MRKILQYLRILLTVGLPIIFSPIYLGKYSRHPEKYPLEVRYAKARKLISKVVRAFRTDIVIINKHYWDELDGQRYLWVSNHLSMYEILAYIYVSEKPIIFAAKEETLKMPFVGRIFRMLNGIALDRKNVMNQLAEIKQIVNHIKDESMPIMGIFPEGTRNKEPEKHCLEFKGGSMKLAYMAKVPILPVSTYGSFRALSKKHYLKSYPLFIQFDKPITPEEYKDIPTVELATKLQHQIDENVDCLRALDKEKVYAQKLSNKRKEKETWMDTIS